MRRARRRRLDVEQVGNADVEQVVGTDAPPAGAGPVSVTVPVADVPPTTAGDVNVTVERLGAGAAEPAGLIVSRACGA